MLGISHNALAVYVRSGKIPSPEEAKHGERTVHSWTEEEVEHVRKLLPKIANGRKTRWQRQREADRRKQRKSEKKTQARAPAPHKKQGSKKKK